METVLHLVQIVLLTLWFHRPVLGHGRLLEPPSRASMWRFGYKTPRNYNDNQLFCGGVGVQYSSKVGGKCGVCGDPWNGPRENEAGGKFATGTIVRKYKIGQIINVTVDLTANHKGFFEFRMCPTDNPFKKVTWDCLNKHILQVSTTGLYRYAVEKKGYGSDKFRIKLRLPKDIKCRACMLQWKYNAGNSWGVGENGNGCIGCGNQEQFYGCADVAIGHDDVVLGEPAEKKPWHFKKDGDDDWSYGVVNSNDTSGNSGHSDNLRGSMVWLYDACLVLALVIFPMYL